MVQPDGSATVNTYDLADQLLTSETDGSLVHTPTHLTQQSFGYDPAGNQTVLTAYDGGQTTTQYDADNRVLQTVAVTTTATITTTNGYDPDGNTLTQTVQTRDTSVPALAQTHTASYNSNDWTTSSSDDGLVVSYGYDATGQERSRSGGGSTIGTALNAAGLITQTTESTGGTGPYTDTSGYNQNDLLTSVTLGTGCDSRRGPAHRRGARGRGRLRPEPLPLGGPSGGVGRASAGQQRECGQGAARPGAQGQSLAAGRLGRSSASRRTEQGQLLGCPVSTPGGAPGKKRAAVAVAHSILTIAFHLLTTGAAYRDLGVTDFDQRDRQAVERRLMRRLEALGYTVSLQPPAPTA